MKSVGTLRLCGSVAVRVWESPQRHGATEAGLTFVRPAALRGSRSIATDAERSGRPFAFPSRLRAFVFARPPDRRILPSESAAGVTAARARRPAGLNPSAARGPARKVRAAQGTVLDNVQAGKAGGQPPAEPDGKCNRKIPLGK